MRNVYFLAMDQDDSQICLRLLLLVVSAFVCCVCFSTRCFRPQKLAQLFQEISCKIETIRSYIIHLFRAFKS